MYTPQSSRLFTKHINRQSGIEYYVLSSRVAPVQQGMYFCNSGFSDDGRYLWFYTAFPPANGHVMAVIDFLTDEIHCYPETAGGSGQYVDPRTGDLWWGSVQGIYKRAPHPDARPQLMVPVPEELRQARVRGMGTHLTFTQDYNEIFADVQTACGSYLCSFNLSDGSWAKWYRTEPDVPYNHGQFCPGNPDLAMCAHEGGSNARNEFVPPPLVDGVYPRLQIITRGGERKMIVPVGNYATHEWWSRDGRCVYYCGQDRICRDNLDGTPGETICHVPLPEDGNGTWHAFSSVCDRYFVTDGSIMDHGMRCWRGCPSIVRFYNDVTGKIVDIVSRNPVVEGWTPEDPCPYHIDPHPRFVLGDSLVTFTTTVCGCVDLAIAPVDQLVRATE